MNIHPNPVVFTGLSIRDYFAGQAMIGEILNDRSALDVEHGRRMLAVECYAIADAMLKAREAAP